MQQQVEQQLTEWRGLLGGSVTDARQVLREILSGPIVLTPTGGPISLRGTWWWVSGCWARSAYQPLWCARQVSNLRPPV